MNNNDERDHAEEAYNRATDRETYGEPESRPATYKFDVVAVVTFDITTAHGPDAARQAAESVEDYEPGCGVNASPAAPDIKFDVTCVAPRSKAYPVQDEPQPGDDTIPEPLTENDRDVLKSELDTAIEALEGDSNDAEHDALYGLASMVAAVLGLEFDPRAPGDFEDEDAAEDNPAVQAIIDAELSRHESGPCNR